MHTLGARPYRQLQQPHRGVGSVHTLKNSLLLGTLRQEVERGKPLTGTRPPSHFPPIWRKGRQASLHSQGRSLAFFSCNADTFSC